MATCKEIVEILDLYLDGELDDVQGALVREHLEKCPFCKSVVEKRLNERRVIQQSFPVPELNSCFKESVISQIALRKQQPEKPLWFLFFKPPLVATLVGCFLLVGMLSFLPASPFFKGHRQPSGLCETENSEVKNDFKISENEGIKISKIDEQLLIEKFKKDGTENPNKDIKVGSQNLDGNLQNNIRSFDQYSPEKILSGRRLERGLDDEKIAAEEFACPKESIQNIDVSFSFAYLPYGFKLENLLVYSLETREKNSVANLMSDLNIYCGEEPLLLIFSNKDTKERFYVGIFPLQQSVNINPQKLFFSIFSESQIKETAGQGPFIWYMEKEGHRFLFGIVGKINSRELETIAASSY